VSGSSAPTSVVIADDHAVVRRGLRALFDGHGDVSVVGEASDVGETFDCVREQRPDVLLLDLHMGGRSSLTEIAGLRETSAGTAIVVLTMQTDPLFAREALMSGAAGFVTKQAPDETVIEAVRAVAAGGTYLDPAVGVGAVTGGPGAGAAVGDLSSRETDVLRMIALGHTNPEIAESLHVGLRTVETHRSHIQQKLGLSKRADLVRYALDHGLVGSER
jgi:two-component system response regulator NreC